MIMIADQHSDIDHLWPFIVKRFMVIQTMQYIIAQGTDFSFISMGKVENEILKSIPAEMIGRVSRDWRLGRFCRMDTLRDKGLE
jgi:hypothetical protein